MLTQVNFTIANGGLGRTSSVKDGYSCLVEFSDEIATLTTFTATNNILKFNTLAEVEATGIVSTDVNFKYLHYQASEFFRMGGSDLFIAIFPAHSSTNIGDIEDIIAEYQAAIESVITFTNGDVRLFAINSYGVDFSTLAVLGLQASADRALELKKPIHIFYSASFDGVALSAMPDLTAMSNDAPNVSVTNSGDAATFATYGTVLGNVGALMGAASSTDVATNILYVSKFNYASGGKMVEPCVMTSDGTDGFVKVSDALFTKEVADALAEKAYIFYRFLPNVAGTFISNDYTAVSSTNDIYAVRLSRTLGKAIRLVDGALSQLLGSKIKPSLSGTLSRPSAAGIENAVNSVLTTMVTALELSAFKVVVDTTTVIVGTGVINLTVRLQPMGSSDYFNVNLGFSANV